MGQNQSVLLVGGPNAGKTNYLASFWLAVCAERGYLAGNGLPENLEYLDEIAQELGQGKFVKRTNLQTHVDSVIPVKSKLEADYRGNLVVPDCSGEEWRSIYERREWASSWEQRISDTCGCLLFYRPFAQENVPPLDYATCRQLLQAAADSAHGKVRIPTQVIMLDWLECLRTAFTEHFGGAFRPRVGIVVTAWDRLHSEVTQPSAFLDNELPLLAQFAETNQDRFEFGVFGVSSVGGDLQEEPGFQKAFLDHRPGELAYVVHELNGQAEVVWDITLPVAWALRLPLEQRIAAEKP